MSNYTINEQVTAQVNGRLITGKVITKPARGNTHTILTAEGKAFDVELPVKQKEKAAA